MRFVGPISTATLAFVFGVADAPEGVESWQPWAALLAGVGAIAVGTRARTRPWGAVALLIGVIALSVGADVAGEPGQVPFGLYLVAAGLLADSAWSQTPRVLAGLSGLAVVTATVGEGLAADRGPSDVITVVMMWAAAISVSLAVRWRRQASEARDDRVRLLERERIARDLHDTVAHHVSAIALTAEGARGLVDQDQAMVERSLGMIHTTAATALDEMRAMVDVLRSDEPEAPLRLGDLGSAIVPDTRLAVSIDVTDGVASMTGPVVAAIHRITQELVTNARRHAHGATNVAIRVEEWQGAVWITGTDDGRGSVPSSNRGGGHGLAGMRERAELLGGTFEAGPMSAGGWRVAASFPIDRAREGSR